MMEFRIADTFTDSLARLSGDEQKVAKTTAFDLQMNPENPGMQFHKLSKAKDRNFWSVRVSGSIRMIVHKTQSSILLCYVDHHDPAYSWAERRKLETHPKTGAAQLVELRERVEEIVISKHVETSSSPITKPLLFRNISDDELLGFGVPLEWLGDVRSANEDSLLRLADHLPAEAAEALLDLATGTRPEMPQPAKAGSNPFDHPDAQRRFRIMSDTEELAQALEYPWEKWTVFLHPAQRQLIEKTFTGPARVSGSAGTGKTIVALHRAVFLAKANPDARILLTTFSDTLANALRAKLRILISNEPRISERLETHSLDAIGRRLYEVNFGRPLIATSETIGQILEQSSKQVKGHKFGIHFLQTEWEQIVDAWNLKIWEAYRDVTRLGRKTRLPEHLRAILWNIFDRVWSALTAQNMVTYSGIFSQMASHFSETKHVPFDFAVVDEAQDISVSGFRFLSSLGGGRPDSLFFTGDLGQRIFQQPFSWKSLGVDIRGRSRTLRINYRTSHQIRSQADRLLGPELSDVDGNAEKRTGTISIFNGPQPKIMTLDNPEKEIAAVGRWLLDRLKEGVKPQEIGVLVRSKNELDRARAAVEKSRTPLKILDEKVEITNGHISICMMSLAKGLEFRSVCVMGCDDEIIPLQERIETVADDADLEEVYNTERHLLYVACTRARDHLLVTSGATPSEFLDDLRG
jgi:mRNA-degrading endonuclease RelE of RelBE toxin-antitoxin system